ncbi:T9SS type B sorting domain-containing protein [Winogradskyella ursingii]|uniref:T9SS type B sorting domain-containing protein n=1 Tax=Winogradskyella ursingii TaxID=2686079 RepID=UPI0015CB8AF7|nr:T9SS type B sorting domain-containing protein [Winogradskyella ursingii]
MKRKSFLILILLISFTCYAQNEASYWYFGQNAGLRFNTTTGTVNAVTDGQINTLEGCTSISDKAGNLQFYTDGQTVWNRNHQIMSQGDYFGGTGLLGDPSSTSSGLIVPKPEDPIKYYIFTVDEPHHDNAAFHPNQNINVPAFQDDGFNNGFNYSLVDMSLNGGLGDVDTSEKNIPLITYDPSNSEHVKYKCSEKITAVRAEDCSSFWVITHFIDSFYAFKVETTGVITTPVKSTVGPVVPISGYRRNALGYLKASPDASKLVVAHQGLAQITAGEAPGNVFLFDFDNNTGIVSNALELYGEENNNSAYGVEFSAENRKVYASIGIGPAGNNASQILQWDLESADIPNSLQVIHTSSNISAGALQLGVDRRIYRAQFSFNGGDPNAQRYLGVINNPELNGSLADYDERGILLDVNGGFNNTGRIGLPPFIQSLFNSQTDIIRNGLSTTELKLCDGDNYTLQADDIIGADYIWTLDGNPLAETSSELFIDTPGFYEVVIEPNNGECPIEGSAVVGVFDIPLANPLSNLRICDNSGNDGKFEFDFTSKNSETLLTQDPTMLNVRYFESSEDANNLENEITFPYTNSSNPMTIHVRVDNVENNNCFDLNSFELEVFNTPEIVQLNNIDRCDVEDNLIDGITTIDLSEFIPEIRGDQPESDVNITFHSSQNDAENDVGALPLMYKNNDPFSETIYVRIENTTNTVCYTTDSFMFTVFAAPIANNSSILQCDEDGIQDGKTIFNINQIVDDITGGATGRWVEYYRSLNDAQDQMDAIDGDNFENITNPETVYARVTDTGTGCVNFCEVSLEVSTTTSNDTSLSECDDDGIEDGLTEFDLSMANSIVLAGSPAGLDIEYFETYEDALLETDPIGTTFTNTVAYNQTVYARVENGNACYGISEIELTVLRLPNIETELETFYCLNFFPETIRLDGGLIDDLPNNYFYEWSTGENTLAIEVNEPGTYTVRVTGVNGCFKDRTITVLPSNIATVTDIEVVDASQNNSVTVMVSGQGDYEYALDSIDGPYQDSNTFDNVQPGLYTVYVRDRNDCGITEQLVSVVGFPKFFTPNGDGQNDIWRVRGISSRFQANTKILIFDRYGKLLRELDPLGPGWDGTHNGQRMPTSDYWFKVKLEDGRTFTSHFTLKR